MKGIKTVVTLVAMAAAAVAFGPNATAQDDVTPKFKITPNVLSTLQDFQVQTEDGTCPRGLESVTSPGFLASVGTGSVHGKAGEQPGKFTATLKCHGNQKTGTAEFEVVDRNFLPKFKIVPSTLKPGQHFQVQIQEGDCPEGGTVSSPGFREPKLVDTLHGVAGDQPGKYSATLYCDSPLTSYSSTPYEIVPLTPNDTFALDKTEYAPGEKITATAPVSAKCRDDLTSTGFTAPIKLSRKTEKLMVGTGTAVGAPGTYTASMTCDNITVRQTFSVKAPKAKAPVVRPKGAPETGGGGTA